MKPIGYFSKIYAEELPHRAKAVYMYLKDRSDKKGQCYPAIGTIAKELHLSRRTVERAIEDLIRAGLLKRSSGGGKWWKEQPALYTDRQQLRRKKYAAKGCFALLVAYGIWHHDVCREGNT